MMIFRRFKLMASFAEYKEINFPGFNVNQEEHRPYLKKVQKAQKDLAQMQSKDVLPRRKRRIYDKPRYDLDITNYTAWRVYIREEMLDKEWAHGAVVTNKLYLQPKWVIHAFGQGLLPLFHYKSVHKQFSFEDCNLSKFLLYEFRNTTLFEANKPDYDYENQGHLHHRQRLRKRMSPEEFWQSQEKFQFRLNMSAYGEWRKFSLWVQKTIEQSKQKESYDEFINKKYGHVISFNKKQDRSHFEAAVPKIMEIGPQHYEEKKKGAKTKPVKIQLAKKLDDEYRIKTEKEKEEKTAES